MKTDAHVYVIAFDDKVKVGHAKRPDARHKELRIGGEIAHITPLLAQAELVERTAHRLLDLAGKRVRGEYFSATVCEAVDAIEKAQKIVSGGELPLQFKPKRPVIVKMYNVDQEFLDAVNDLRCLESPIPTPFKVIKQAVLEMRDRERERGKR